MRERLLQGDCMTHLPTLFAESVDALVTDPPAGVAFMRAEWDGDKGGREQWVSWLSSVMSECMRVLKPGSFGLVWALPRTSHWTGDALERAGFEVRDVVTHLFGQGFPKASNLKPACEFWWLVRKPTQLSAADNAAFYRSGSLQIDETRIGSEQRHSPPSGNKPDDAVPFLVSSPDYEGKTVTGRWPANVLLDDALPLNGAARYFYCAKVSHRERERGLEGLELRSFGMSDGAQGAIARGEQAYLKDVTHEKGQIGLNRLRRVRNHHPTVKPLELMRYLVKLVTPAGGIVLDPFMGSGTTGMACVLEQRRFIGIEQDAEFYEIARRRMRWAQLHKLGLETA